jgi:hypothetical protein
MVMRKGEGMIIIYFARRSTIHQFEIVEFRFFSYLKFWFFLCHFLQLIISWYIEKIKKTFDDVYLLKIMLLSL